MVSTWFVKRRTRRVKWCTDKRPESHRKLLVSGTRPVQQLRRPCRLPTHEVKVVWPSAGRAGARNQRGGTPHAHAELTERYKHGPVSSLSHIFATRQDRANVSLGSKTNHTANASTQSGSGVGSACPFRAPDRGRPSICVPDAVRDGEEEGNRARATAQRRSRMLRELSTTRQRSRFARQRRARARQSRIWSLCKAQSSLRCTRLARGLSTASHARRVV